MAPCGLWDKIQTWWHCLHSLLKSDSKLPFMLYLLQILLGSSNSKSYHSLNQPWLLTSLACYSFFLHTVSTWRINTNKLPFPLKFSLTFLSLSLLITLWPQIPTKYSWNSTATLYFHFRIHTPLLDWKFLKCTDYVYSSLCFQGLNNIEQFIRG